MGKPAKKQITVRLSEETISELSRIANNKKVSQADVISILVHLYYISGDIKNIDNWFEIAKRS